MQATSSVPPGPRTTPFGEFLAALIHSLGEEGIRLHVLRNYDGFPADNNSRDLDLLIPRGELPLALRVLGSIQGIRIVGYAERHYVASVLLEGISVAAGARSLQVDFYLTLTWKGIPYLRMDTLLQAAIPRRAGSLRFYVLNPIHEAIVSLFAGLLLGGVLKEKYFPQAQRTFAEARIDAIEALQPQFGLKAATRLVDSVIEGDRRKVIACVRPLRAALALRSLQSPIRNARNITRHYAREFAARFTPEDLETVCILGPRSRGKSQMVERLMPILQSSSVVVEERKIGPYLPSALKAPAMALREGADAENRGHDSASSVKVVRWLFQEWLSQFVGKTLPTLRVCESSYYHLLADPESSSSGAPKWLLRLVGRLLPSADLWILLEPSSEGAQSSGQNVPSTRVPTQIAAYRSFVKMRKRYMILDASKPLDAVVEDAYVAIIDTLAERASKKLKSRFK